MTLTEFLLARIADDEKAAQTATFEDWWTKSELDAFHLSRWLPTRVLVECDAKRHIIKQARMALQISDAVPDDEPDEVNNNGRKHGYAQAFDLVLELMARPYAKHPDYQKEWAE